MRNLKLHLRGASKSFAVNGREIQAFHSVDLDIQAGEFVSILGPSGCGKTTLLRVLSGLEHHTAGTIQVRHADPNKPLSATVFQEPSTFPWMRVWDNIAYGLRMRGTSEREIRQRVETLLDKMGLTKFAHVYPHQVSSGMKQRIAIGRAFAVDPEILYMDEPFGQIDEQTRLGLQQELLRIWEETRKTVVFVTHSIDEAIILADRVVVMSAHPGTIREIVTVPFERPRDLFDLHSRKDYSELARHLWLALRATEPNVEPDIELANQRPV